MHTQRQMLELARQRQSASYTELAEKFGISRQALSQFKLGAPFSPDIALKVAETAGLDPAYVFACVERQRSQRLERTESVAIWERIAEHFAAVDTRQQQQQHSASHQKRQKPHA